MFRLKGLLITVLAASACSDLSSAPTAPSSLASSTPSYSVTDERSTTTSAPAPTPSAANYEQKFMTDMIDHHAMAIMMAEMCVERAMHPELRQMCEDIITAQSAEIQTMQTWLQDWYSLSYSPQMKRSMEAHMQHMARMTPEEFEIAFMEMMIRHHESAVKEGERCIDKAYHPELIGLCENIVATQSAEIAQMEAWLCQWYGRC